MLKYIPKREVQEVNWQILAKTDKGWQGILRGMKRILRAGWREEEKAAG